MRTLKILEYTKINCGDNHCDNCKYLKKWIDDFPAYCSKFGTYLSGDYPARCQKCMDSEVILKEVAK